MRLAPEGVIQRFALTDIHHNFTADLLGQDPRDPRYASDNDGGCAGAAPDLDGGLPPGGLGAPEPGTPATGGTTPPAAETQPGPAAPPVDDDAVLAGWAGKGASAKSPDPSDDDPQVQAQRRALGDAVGRGRDAVTTNDKLKIVPPQKNKAGKVVEPGGFQYPGARSPDPPALDVPGDEKRSSVNKAIWGELGSREGGVSAINTWDTAGLTVGGGFAAKDGQLPAVMTAFLKNDPEARAALEKVGFTCKDGKFMAVDAASGRVLEGNAAIDAIKADPKVLSRLIEVLENPENAKKFADAEWAQIRKAAGDVPADVLASWDEKTILMVAHFVHWTGVGWKTWAAVGSNIADLLREGVKHAHKDPSVGGATMVASMDTAILLGSAHGCGKQAVKGPGPLPEDISEASYAGHVFMAAGKDSYWHLEP